MSENPCKDMIQIHQKEQINFFLIIRQAAVNTLLLALPTLLFVFTSNLQVAHQIFPLTYN